MLAAVLLLAVAVATIVWLQTVPDPRGLPVHPTWTRAEQLLGQTLPKFVSIDPDQSWAALCRPLLILLAFLCAFMAATERSGAAILFQVARYAGAAYAAYGIAALLVDPDTLLGIQRSAYVGDLTGTFVNRNTAGTFFGTVLILWFVTLLSELDKKVPRSALGIRDLGSAILDAPPRALVVAALGTGLCFVALMLTRSRAGILFTFASLFLTTLIVLRHRLSGRAGLFAGGAVVAMIGAFTLELFGGAVAGRIGMQGLVDEGRLATYAASADIIREHPWWGTGLASFRDVFAAYRSPEVPTNGVWDRAHSTPLEIAIEIGLPGALLVSALWVAGLARLLYGALTRRRESDLVAAAFGAGLLGTLHSLIDFSPQVPGYAVLWVTLLGCGLAQSVRGDWSETTRDPVRSRGEGPLPATPA